MADWTGITPIRQFAHVKITHRRHSCYGMTGTVIRMDREKRKVWVSLPDGRVVPAGHRSVEVLTPKSTQGAGNAR
jgi:hypothetical protein